MNLSRFFLGLALLAFKFASDPFAGSNFAYTLGRAIGELMVHLLWGWIIWALTRLIRGADKAPDVRRFSLYIAAIMVSFSIVFRFFVGTPLSSSERLEFSAGFEKGCFSGARKSEDKASLTDSQLHEYCSCISSLLSTEVTEEEAKFIVVNKVIPSSLQKKSQEVAARCGRQLLQKWQGGNK